MASYVSNLLPKAVFDLIVGLALFVKIFSLNRMSGRGLVLEIKGHKVGKEDITVFLSSIATVLAQALEI